MTSNYYFEKWKSTLNKLEELVKLDMEYQETKAHDKKCCGAAQRLTGVLGSYMFLYNEATDCCRHNLQVQKAGYIAQIVKCIAARILELKEQLRKLEASNCQFMGHGLINKKLTTYDVELTDIPMKHERPENIQVLVYDALQNAKDVKEKALAEEAAARSPEKLSMASQNINWWDDKPEDTKGAKEHKGIDVTAVYETEKEEELSPEDLKRRNLVTLIQAHERLKQVTLLIKRQSQKRERWEKELKGTLQTPAREELRERSAKMIQKVCRVYFEIKRQRIKDCKRDEILDLRLCSKPNEEIRKRDIELSNRFPPIFKKYEAEWKENCNQLMQHYMNKNHDEIENDTRDEIMNWFQEWYEKANFFHNIPTEIQGGSKLIVTDELPTPAEWLEKYEKYLALKKANKNKTSYDLKREKEEAKQEALAQKKAEHLKKKLQEALLKKMMKNPNFHPGYHYPESKTMEHILKAIEDYQRDWFELDTCEVSGIKEKFVVDVDKSNAYMEAKLEIRKSVDVAMREKLKVLNQALKIDYATNNEKMPDQIKDGSKRRRKKRKAKMECKENVGKMLEDLALSEVLVEYPQTTIKDFLGDPNFAGDDMRCMLYRAVPYNGEIRALWWDRCREVTHGSNRILLVGARGSGRTILVHAMASVNDAVLYKIDPDQFSDEVSPLQLQLLVNSLATCAKCTQPSVIYIKHVEKMYYTKMPPEGKAVMNLIKRFLVGKLLKRIHKSDNITVVASWSEPWLASSKQMLKKFPQVVMLPETTYSTVSLILRNWVLDNTVIPKDLDLQTLARALQGYSFGHIEKTLNDFLSAERIVKIAVHGLNVAEIYDYFLEGTEDKIDYAQYLKWHTDKTHWGQMEQKRIEEQKEFQLLVEKWQEKKKKGSKKQTIGALPTLSETSMETDEN